MNQHSHQQPLEENALPSIFFIGGVLIIIGSIVIFAFLRNLAV